MKQIAKEYAKIFSYTITGIVFVFASFYLIINIYHMEEIADTFTFSLSEDSNYNEIKNRISNIEKYTNVNINKSKGKANKQFLSSLNTKLSYCKNALNNETFKELKNNKKIGIKDVYNLRNTLNSNVINGCLIEQLHYLTYYNDKDGNSDGLSNYSDYIKLNIDIISSRLNYIDKDLLNNSSYYYNSSNASTAVMNKTKDMYDDVMTTYNQSATLVEMLSKWLYTEVGVTND